MNTKVLSIIYLILSVLFLSQCNQKNQDSGAQNELEKAAIKNPKYKLEQAWAS